MYSVASVSAASAGRATPIVTPPAPLALGSAVQVTKLTPVVGSVYVPSTICALHGAATRSSQHIQPCITARLKSLRRAEIAATEAATRLNENMLIAA